VRKSENLVVVHPSAGRIAGKTDDGSKRIIEEKLPRGADPGSPSIFCRCVEKKRKRLIRLGQKVMHDQHLWFRQELHKQRIRKNKRLFRYDEGRLFQVPFAAKNCFP
jgi:hypothetical protein